MATHSSVLAWRMPCVPAKLLQLNPTLCDHMGCSPPAYTIQGVLWARILAVAMPSSRGSSQPIDRLCVSCGS